MFHNYKVPLKMDQRTEQKIQIKASKVAEEENIDNLEFGSDSRMQHQNHNLPEEKPDQLDSIKNEKLLQKTLQRE